MFQGVLNFLNISNYLFHRELWVRLIPNVDILCFVVLSAVNIKRVDRNWARKLENVCENLSDRVLYDAKDVESVLYVFDNAAYYKDI